MRDKQDFNYHWLFFRTKLLRYMKEHCIQFGSNNISDVDSWFWFVSRSVFINVFFEQVFLQARLAVHSRGWRIRDVKHRPSLLCDRKTGRERVCGRSHLTFQEALALLEPHSVRVALLRGGGVVALRHGHDGGSVPHQELTQVEVVAGGGAVQRSPAVHGKVTAPWHQSRRGGFRSSQRMSGSLPAMTVRGADVGPNANQEVHHVVVPPADGVMQPRDAFIVGLAGIGHLWRTVEQS